MDDDLPPDVVALARALRDLFAGLCVSTRRYAARRAYDSSTVSRYLSGRRLPPWEFILNLLHDVGEARGSTPTTAAVDMLRTLHTAALESGSSPAHRTQLLERELAEADREARSAATRERWLEDTLQDREHRIRDLEMRNRELEARLAAAEANARLNEEIRELKEELARVRALHQQAEERCEQLERLLAETEETGLLPEPLTSDFRTPDFRPEADVHNNVVAAPGAPPLNTVYQFGHVNGSVTMITDTWQVDEEYVASVSVRLYDAHGQHLGNGLLFDAETVITADPGPNGFWLGPQGRAMSAGTDEWKVPVEPIEAQAFPPLKVLRLAEPVAFPDRSLAFEQRPTPGRQLLVSAHAMQGRYSCLLDVKGRSGDLLRASGEFVDGLVGAPAFSSAGALTGLVMDYSLAEERGLLLPVAALRTLTTVKLPD
ncbi:hypothetical protein GCM10020221_22850 [Streptomyces thioluteus]|uniref:Uncharacterized protein n=2 Tax=Streptomyces thioluteus TaxID=66431 RepID=A0ABN3WS89_STRTU